MSNTVSIDALLYLYGRINTSSVGEATVCACHMLRRATASTLQYYQHYYDYFIQCPTLSRSCNRTHHDGQCQGLAMMIQPPILRAT